MLSQAVKAQSPVAGIAPTQSLQSTKFFFGYVPRYSLTDDSQEIRQELQDTALLGLIARTGHLTPADLATVKIVSGLATNVVYLFQLAKPDTAFNVFKTELGGYVQHRQLGHSPAFLFAALTNRLQNLNVGDRDLRAIAAHEPWLPVNWLRKDASESVTNHAGEIMSVSTVTTVENGERKTISVTNTPSHDAIVRLERYSVVDANIGWRYAFSFSANGNIESVEARACDPLELDPKYTAVLKTVDEEVSMALQRKRITGLYSTRVFWDWKKKVLQAQGIEWRSPAELNPGIIYE